MTARHPRSLVLVALILLPRITTAQARDAGPPPGAGKRHAADARAADTRAGDLGPRADGWLAGQLRTLEADLVRVQSAVKTTRGLKATDVTPSRPLEDLAGVELADPGAVTRHLALLATRRRPLSGRHRAAAERLRLMEPSLGEPARQLARARKRPKRRHRKPIPAALLEQVRQAAEQLKLLRLERDLFGARVDLVDALVTYLKSSQPARVAARKQQDEAARKAAEEKKAAEQAHQRAQAEGESAAQAQRAALEAQRRALSEADRLLAAERARLEGIRGLQAGEKVALARLQADLARQRVRLEKFRGEVAAALDRLPPRRPLSPARHDLLYDQVVTELTRIRPLAVEALLVSIRGLPDAPQPNKALPEPVRKLAASFSTRIAMLEQLRARLARAAVELETRQRTFHAARLELLAAETGRLNDHRITLMARISVAKRAELTGVSRAAAEQLAREATQLVLDGLYWAHRRLGQVDRIPGLIRNVFTMGSLMWTLIKLFALMLLLRFVLRRWDGWMGAAVARLGREMTLGRQTLRATKLVDVLRHAGPALLVLLTGVALFRMLGGREAAAELRGAYVLFFWIMAYRLQLRVVESMAKHMGLELALRAVEGETLAAAKISHAEQEGPPAPGDLPASSLPKDNGKRPIQEPSVLLVRSVRVFTRYLLAVVLVLELTALLVGKGSIYRVTARFSWWAALPFLLYYLQLWRPHIQRAYWKQLGQREEGRLARLVKGSERRFYGVFVIGVAFAVVAAARVAAFARRYLSSLDATKKLLAFFFRRQVEKHAQQEGRILLRRHGLPDELLDSFPMGPLPPSDGPRRLALMDEIRELFETWRKDHSDGSAAIVGSAGMGKTTTLLMLEQELGTPVLHGEARVKITNPAKVVSWLAEVFNISPRPTSERDLVRRIREEPHQVVALDACHNLFLRQVGGFRGWECLLRVVNETCDNVFWFLAFNHAAHDYLQQISGRVQYLRRVFHLPRWTEDELRRDIMQKMRRARHGVSFSDLVVTRLQGLSTSAQAGRTSSGYFRMLWDFTDGNPRLASHFWLDSLVPRQEERAVRVHLFATPEVEELERLPSDMRFVLTTISQHENLTAAETIGTTDLPADFCGFALRLGLEDGLLVREPDSGRLRLSLRWQQTVHRYLRRQRLLYG